MHNKIANSIRRRDRRRIRLVIVANGLEATLLRRAAKAAGESVSAFLRRIGLAIAKEVLHVND